VKFKTQVTASFTGFAYANPEKCSKYTTRKIGNKVIREMVSVEPVTDYQSATPQLVPSTILMRIPAEDHPAARAYNTP